MKKWRLIDTGFADCYTNMAIDEAMFTEFVDNPDMPQTLRLYGFKPAAFSTGCFQDVSSVLNIAECKRRNVPFVRRITGGDTIFHADEITYSLVIKQGDMGLDTSVKDSFRAICSFLIETYKRLGLKPHFGIEEKKRPKAKNGFCFSSHQEYDIIIDGKKIGGNAQKRYKDFIFQHGSIPLTLDYELIESLLKPGCNIRENTVSLNELLGKEISHDRLKGEITAAFEKAFSVRLYKKPISYIEEYMAAIISKRRYLLEEWNLHKNDDAGVPEKTRLA